MTRFQQLMALRDRFERGPIAWQDDIMFVIIFGGAAILLVLVIYFIAWEVFA